MTPCPHIRYEIHTRLGARATLLLPEEWDYKAQCLDCGEWLDVEDLPADEPEERENEA